MKMYGVDNVIPRKCSKCGDIMTIGHFPPDTKNDGVWYWACVKAQNSCDCNGWIEISDLDNEDIPDELKNIIIHTDDNRKIQKFR